MGIDMDEETSILGFIRSVIVRLLMASDDPSEHTKFFQSGFSMSGEEAARFATFYIAACYYLGNDPGFGAKKMSVILAGSSFDSEFAKAGLGTVVRDASGGTNIKLRIANHLEGKTNARDALRNMAPSRRCALQMEIQKLTSIPSSAWIHPSFRSRYVAWGVRG
jgi:hypothetical protein